MGGGGGARSSSIRWIDRSDGSATTATDISNGGIAVKVLSGTDAVRVSTWVTRSGRQCFWHSGLAEVPCICAQPSSMLGIEFISAAADVASGTVGQT